MSEQRRDDPEPRLLHLLEPDEQLHVAARARDAYLAVTDRRVVVMEEGRIALDIGFDELRRIQFDVEADRPATLVIVPESALDEPQVLAIPADAMKRTTEALAVIGARLALRAQRER